MTLHPWTVTLRHETHVPVDLPSALVYAACAVAVALLTRRRPALGVAALLVLAPFDLARYVGPTTITTLKAGLLGMLGALAFSHPDLAAFRTFPVRAMLLAFGATLAAIALSALHAEHLGAVVREAFKDAEYLLLFLGAVAAFATDPDDRPFWRMLEAAVALVCLSALAEYVVGAHSGVFVHGQSFPRIAGALEGPNQLAGYLDVALPVLVARALVHRDRALTAVIALAAVTDLLTISRAGIVGAVIGLLVVLLVLRRSRGTVWRFAAAAAVVVALGAGLAVRAGAPAGYFTLDQATQAQDHLANRSQLWHAAVALWQRSPLVGVGAGNYELDLPEVGLTGVRTHANSIYLQSLAEGGLLGLAATVALFAVTLVTLARSGVRRPLVVGALGAAVALAAHQVLDDLFFFPKVASAYWLVVGVAVAEVAARRLFERRRAEPYVAAPAAAPS
ncbi:MAG TPA: O-antigen ligase family protein [Candidatus Elarobacter sp.]|nr:O-antigen ligase family protein [Dongiaceae bacterium]HZW54404.1 O-antigen ligase family protein [Candidatus Elarobacter sp.]